MSKKYHKFSWLILAEGAGGLSVIAGCHDESIAWDVGQRFLEGTMVCKNGKVMGIRDKSNTILPDIMSKEPYSKRLRWREPTEEEKERAANCIKQWRANY